ncbi:MAG: NERD domain-containing protein, partial [Deltaproteobacteria bacterium]|nr:NERD domain-containing protein [Deltaproteobacteria bacterium]
MAARWFEKGKPVHEAERRGLEALIRALPEDYTVFTNIDLPGNRPGQSYEHDAVVVAPHAVFTVELKSWGGRIVGNRDRWTLQDGFVVPSPIPLALHKARVLKGQLKAKRVDLGPVWLQPVVFLTPSDAHAHISEDFADYVVTPSELKQTFTD